MTEHYGGRVVGAAGDSLLVEFASAVAAVECAVAIQLGMAERNAGFADEEAMLLRMGINIGEVIFEGDDKAYLGGKNTGSLCCTCGEFRKRIAPSA